MTNCEFFLIRYVPDLIKNEPVNIGLVMLDSDGGERFAGVRFASNFERVRCLDANADVEMIHALAEDMRHANQTLQAGDVVTLEPGLYVRGTGGIRIEHNYLIGGQGFERLSQHVIALT